MTQETEPEVDEMELLKNEIEQLKLENISLKEEITKLKIKLQNRTNWYKPRKF
jgi:cell division protein FtsB